MKDEKRRNSRADKPSASFELHNKEKEGRKRIDLKSIIIKFLKSEVFKYLFFGGLTTIVSIGSYALFSEALSVGGQISELGVQTANLGSWVLAVLFAYVTNKFFVFGSKALEWRVLRKEIAGFFGARVFSLVVEAAWLFVTVRLGMNDKLAKVIGQVFVVVINYIFSKLFIFKKEKN